MQRRKVCGLSGVVLLSQFSIIVPIKTAYLRYAVCGCCLGIKNASCYSHHFSAARHKRLIFSAPLGLYFQCRRFYMQQGADTWAFGKIWAWAATGAFRARRRGCYSRRCSWRVIWAVNRRIPATFCWQCYSSRALRRSSSPGKTSPSRRCAASWRSGAAARHSGWTGGLWHRICAAPWTMRSSGRRTPMSAGQSRSTCFAPCWKMTAAPPDCCWRRWGFRSPRRCGSAAS